MCQTPYFLLQEIKCAHPLFLLAGSGDVYFAAGDEAAAFFAEVEEVAEEVSDTLFPPAG
jgi:hypothetical protein